jgi:hypothetical protein
MQIRRVPALLLAVTSPATAQWSASDVTPPGALGAQILTMQGGVMGGSVVQPGAGVPRPAIWTSAGATVLSPTHGWVFCMDGGTQGGHSAGGATIWNGTPESAVYVDFGEVHAARAGQQTGIRYDSLSGQVAMMWRGTPGSAVVLQPAGASQSRAYATDGTRQGGNVDLPQGRHAALWNGSASSWIDLSPTLSNSTVFAMVPGVQVGEAGVSHPHATLWTGTPESRVDLNPPWAFGNSAFYATTGEFHAGMFTQNGLEHAAVCLGTRESWIDLHALLPSTYTSSFARAIERDGDTLYVGGYALAPGQWPRAMLWVGTGPSPAATPLLLAALLAAPRRRVPHR